MGFKLTFSLRYVTYTAGALAIIMLTFSPFSVRAGFFDDFGIKDEAELGRKFDLAVRSQMPIIEDPEIKHYVRTVVNRLSEKIPPQPFPFKTDVILHNSMNAFAVPGGFVFVHTGLIMQLDHESELAGVIAHELAHVTQRHVAKRIDRSKYTNLAGLAGALAGILLGSKGGDAGGALMAGSVAASQAATLNYSRADEIEADQIGLQYLVNAGYRPQGMLGSFEKIRKKQHLSGFSLPEYLSTHPDVENRIGDIASRIHTFPKAVRDIPDNDYRFTRVKTLLLARYGDTATVHHIFSGMGENNALALMGRGLLAERLHRIKKADTLLKRAMSLAPNDALIKREAGSFYYRIGDKRAEKLLDEALTLDPLDSMARYYRARLFYDAGQFVKAQSDFRRLLRTYPDDAELHQYLGNTLGKSRKLCEGWLHLAYSAMYKGNGIQARNFYAKAQKEAKSVDDKRLLDKFTVQFNVRKDYMTDE